MFLSRQSITLRSYLSQCASSPLVCVARTRDFTNILVFVAALIVLYVVFSLINGAQAVYEYVQIGIVESLFAAAFGSWLTWTPTRFYERAA